MHGQVMVVDDDPELRDTIVRILKKGNIEAFGKASGKECLETLNAGFSGLILMDVSMPGMDGWATVQEIVNQGYIDKTIICMLTGFAEPDHDMDPLKEYILDYITKPVKAKELIALVNDYLNYLK